ncbi:hypothetical protein [Rickettsiella endosymbiont of Dermanyssus gallinae]|uniref:hypothetical protein n=1 Tax=Rickettsiella endosymbiont of Dermanyssus gallinae TaxID=2856608 RepID=UPI001C52C7FA|nr:hypothetical protein [Rickettsiella endosymbiont of Dermanyssus gallinae]
MIIKKESYIFSKYHADRLKHTLLNRSFAFNFESFKGYLISETTGIKEAGKVTKITFCKGLLPSYCKLELVEEALASLEMVPNNVQLLKTFADYVENGYSERIGYSFISGVKWGLIATCIVADVPLILSVAACALILSSLFHDNYLEKKLGRLVAYLSEGAHLEPANLAKLEENLIALIGNGKAAEHIGEAAYKEIQRATTHPSAPPPPYSFFPLYPKLETEYQDSVNNTYDNVREYSSALYSN